MYCVFPNVVVYQIRRVARIDNGAPSGKAYAEDR